MIKSIQQLKECCSHMATCLPNTKFIETKNGGYFKKANRTLGVVVSRLKQATSSESFKIRKWKKGYGLNVDPRDVLRYTSIKESVKKGLNIR